jgi:methyltransferase (TIGR00027 family)
VITAFSRAYHVLHNSPPVFDDFLARSLFKDEEFAALASTLAMALPLFDPACAATGPDAETALAAVMRQQSTSITLSRSRYTEETLGRAVREGTKQYIILGAGLDTFAFRCPEMLRELEVFEIDHPATQDYKRTRIAELGWEVPAQLHFIPADFSKESVPEALRHSSYRAEQKSFFSWLGVTYYLAREDVFRTLRGISQVAAEGSGIVFDYFHSDAFVPGRASARMERMQRAVRRAGEPMRTGFDPAGFATELADCGWHLEENLCSADISRRYFQGRTDGYDAFEQVFLAHAAVRRSELR